MQKIVMDAYMDTRMKWNLRARKKRELETLERDTELKKTQKFINDS